MAKRKTGTGTVSAKQRREALLKQKQARQNRLIKVGAAFLSLLVLAIIVWQVVPRLSGGNEDEATAEDSDRPLATLDPAARDGYYNAYPDMVIDPEKSYEALIKTNKGEMRLVLFAVEAPNTVNNFVFLARQGFYDGTIFHRVLPDFMAQAGDPSGTGTGGPGYSFADETDNGLTFDRRGLLAMANSGPDTNGSQFFITFVPTPHLNGAHTIFGELVEGDDILDSITLREPLNGGPADIIERIDIIEN